MTTENISSVYVLRHEQRTSEASYNSGLTSQGLSNSILQLTDRLEKLNIKFIFCSPFIRAIQTVHPYATKFNIEIYVENALVEFLDKQSILPDNYRIQMTDSEKAYWNINKYFSKHCF